MNTLILNKTNATAQANTFQYYFIGSGYEIKPGSKIAISSITIPYSWFNVTKNTNTLIEIIWPNIATPYVFTLDPGFYTVNDIQYFLELKMQTLGLYLKDPSGNYVYYFKMVYNVVYYSVQILLSRSNIITCRIYSTNQLGRICISRPSMSSIYYTHDQFNRFNHRIFCWNLWLYRTRWTIETVIAQQSGSHRFKYKLCNSKGDYL